MLLPHVYLACTTTSVREYVQFYVFLDLKNMTFVFLNEISESRKKSLAKV